MIMKKTQQPTAKNFNPVVKTWPRQRFLDTFRPVYPDANLEALADELGLEKGTKKPETRVSKPGESE